MLIEDVIKGSDLHLTLQNSIRWILYENLLRMREYRKWLKTSQQEKI